MPPAVGALPNFVDRDAQSIRQQTRDEYEHKTKKRGPKREKLLNIDEVRRNRPLSDWSNFRPRNQRLGESDSTYRTRDLMSH